MQRKDCRHTLTNILLPAFYWILCGVGGRYENCWCAVSLGLPYTGLEKIPQFLPFCDYMCCWYREQGEQNLEVGFLSSSVTLLSWPLKARALEDLLKLTGWQVLRVCCMAGARCLLTAWAGWGPGIRDTARTWGPSRNLWSSCVYPKNRSEHFHQLYEHFPCEK